MGFFDRGEAVQKDYKGKVSELLPRMLAQSEGKLGSAKFTRRDKKQVGKVYFRAGGLYAIELTTKHFNLLNRFVTSEEVKESVRDELVQRFRNEPSSEVELIRYVLIQQLIPESFVNEVIKEAFFDSFLELLSWEDVNAEWRTNEEPSVPTIPQAGLAELMTNAEQYSQFLYSTLVRDWKIDVGYLPEATYITNPHHWGPGEYNSLSYSDKIILKEGEEERKLLNVAQVYGIPSFRFLISAFSLWQKGLLDVVRRDGIRISNRTTEDVQSSTTPASSTPAVSHPLFQRAAQVAAGTPSEVSAPTVEEPEVEASASLSVESQATPVAEEAIEAVPSAPAEPVTEEATAEEAIAEEPEVEEPTVEEAVVEESPVEEPTVEEVEEVDNSVEPDNDNPMEEVTLSEETYTPAPLPAPEAAPAAGGSRLAGLLSQIEAELASLDSQIGTLTTEIGNADERLVLAHSRREEFVSQLAQLDDAIVRITQHKAELENKAAALKAERSDADRLLKNR